jgi:hypothetical protein
MARDPEILRGSAAHFRRVAKILADKKAVAELLEIATGLEDRAAKLEANQRDRSDDEASSQ